MLLNWKLTKTRMLDWSFDWRKKRKTETSRDVKYTIIVVTIYVKRHNKTLQGDFNCRPKQTFWSSPLRSDGFWKSQARGWTSKEAAKGTQN